MANARRIVDFLPAPPEHGVQMAILALGMPRTGTLSLFEALKVLGYKPLDATLMEQQSILLLFCLQAWAAEFQHTAKPYGRAEFDKLFMGQWDVACNMPGWLLADALIDAYPDAKVLLTTRDADKWQRSVAETIDTAVRWKTMDWLASWDPDVIDLWWETHKSLHSLRPLLAPNGERQAFLEHYKHINERVPPERLLNFDVSEGWGPLCEFLGKEVPTTPFPHANDRDGFLASRTRRWWQLVRIMLRKISLPLLLCLFAVYWLGRCSCWWLR